MLHDLLERLLSGDGGPAADHVGLGMLLAEAHNRSRERVNDALRPLGINIRGFGVLLALPLYGPVTQRDLIDRTGIDKSTMVRLIDELEDGGLVSRERTPQDRRAYSIVLTPRGGETLEKAWRATDEVGGAMFGRLTGPERGLLVDLLRRLADPAGAPGPDGPAPGPR
ncbi:MULTISPECIES: MarR family winged helix-turn-helix transcriptional regulator [Actinomadura]|uniref:MarR family winged helix-turn-helix transcriptional regulator n=1 Tax=Actinomadura TaxID=1988 RepID=UPI0004067A3F|nr:MULTISPECIES: MarR family transcriptional regulator [Actinomadura]RSN70985.1 MarR family transcriptional regulator [Actinomadura sp. WAC 06369]